MNIIQVDFHQGALVYKGVLTFETSAKALELSQKLLPKKGSVCLDLSGVTRSDSSALALVTELMRRALKKNLKMSIRNIPKKMMDLARVSGLDSIFPIL